MCRERLSCKYHTSAANNSVIYAVRWDPGPSDVAEQLVYEKRNLECVEEHPKKVAAKAVLGSEQGASSPVSILDAAPSRLQSYIQEFNSTNHLKNCSFCDFSPADLQLHHVGTWLSVGLQNFACPPCAGLDIEADSVSIVRRALIQTIHLSSRHSVLPKIVFISRKNGFRVFKESFRARNARVIFAMLHDLSFRFLCPQPIVRSHIYL
ncbi:predicted protein [Histoplasma capsulatum var. duboisii H88]|uniref:Predicted protein n=1 Tax=Ajellomyces capsulatus (strain H88) TaxID=544711 RepID=F0UBC5_AJEC8|nr:predicted protein [Histoplasma capsulatum var. duboisii H88]